MRHALGRARLKGAFGKSACWLDAPARLGDWFGRHRSRCTLRSAALHLCETKWVELWRPRRRRATRSARATEDEGAENLAPPPKLIQILAPSQRLAPFWESGANSPFKATTGATLPRPPRSHTTPTSPLAAALGSTARSAQKLELRLPKKVELTKVLHEHDELLPRDLAALELWHLRLACALHHADCREERLAINKEW